MHVHLAHVSRAISGVTGLAILRALRAGERDPAPLAAFKDSRINASPHTLAKRLEGHWRAEGLFQLRQSLARSDLYQQNIAACDARIEAHRHPCDRTIEVHTTPAPPSTRRPKQARRHAPPVALHPQLSRISGVDLTRIDGIAVRTAQTRMSEIGLDMRRWKPETHVASWLG